MKGAIFIGDNFIWRPEFDGLVEIGSGWTDLDNLLEPQLQPKAEWAADTGVIGFEIAVAGDTSPPPNMIALLGMEMGESDGVLDSLILTVQHWNGSTWEASEVSQYQVPAPGGGRHIILSGMQGGSGGWRVRWNRKSLSGRIGALYAGRLIQSLDLADEDFSMRFVDRGASTSSEGSQIFTGDPAVSRQLRITQATLESIWALGVPPHGSLIELGEPALLDGAAYDSATGFISVAESVAGDAIWGGVMTAGKTYRMDYEQVQNTSNPYSSPRWALETASSGITILNRTAIHAGVGTAILAAGETNPPIYMVGESGLGVGKFRITALSEIGETAHSWSDGFSTNMQSLIKLHGSSRPIIAMLFPSDGARNSATAIYGYMQLPIDMTARSGQRYSQGLTINEQN